MPTSIATFSTAAAKILTFSLCCCCSAQQPTTTTPWHLCTRRGGTSPGPDTRRAWTPRLPPSPTADPTPLRQLHRYPEGAYSLTHVTLMLFGHPTSHVRSRNVRESLGLSETRRSWASTSATQIDHLASVCAGYVRSAISISRLSSLRQQLVPREREAGHHRAVLFKKCGGAAMRDSTRRTRRLLRLSYYLSAQIFIRTREMISIA
jgi:hypothetical protein